VLSAPRGFVNLLSKAITPFAKLMFEIAESTCAVNSCLVYSLHFNIAEILWRKLKYEWLSAADYLDWENLKYQVRLGLSNVGSLLKINFSNFNHSLI